MSEEYIGKRQLHVIGKRLIGPDEVSKVNGNITYADDYTVPGMLHARVFRSTKASAKIKSLDTSAAKALPGVAAVLTANDVPNNKSVTSAVGQTADLGLVQAVPQLVLAEDKVHFYGEPIVILAAETPEIAEDALRLIKIEYEDVPGVYEPEEALKPEAPRVHTGDNTTCHFGLRRGDVDEAFKKADVIVENVYQTQFQEHAHMEPESGVAWIDDDGVLNLRVATQVIEHYRDIATILGIPESRVRTRGTLMGGGFGGKEDLTVEPYIALLAWNTRRPVKLTYERPEMMYGRHKRVPYKMYYKTGATKDGKLVALQAKLIADSGAYVYLGHWILLYTTVHSTGPYYIPNIKVDTYNVLTNNIYTSAFRSFGCIQPAVAYESQMDLLAKKLGMNPAEFRAKNYLKTGDETGTGQKIESEVLMKDQLESAIKALGEPHHPQESYIKVGQGYATTWYPYGRMCYLHDTSSCWIGMETDGSAVVRSGIPDLGGGQRESLRQITAELTGVPLEKIQVINSDSQTTPLAGTTTATRALLMSGNAAKMAAESIRKELIKKASELLNEDSENVDLYNGEAFSIKDQTKKLPLTKIVKAIKGSGNPLEFLATFKAPGADPVRSDILTGQIYPDFTFGAQAVEVEVNTLTGKVSVTKIAGAYDVGTAINPKRVEGQIEGGISQGLGYALTEEFIEVNGIPENISLRTYKIPSSRDMPDVKTIVFESHSGKGPFGAKGIGEPPIVATAPAVLNAVDNAVGIRLKKTPVSAESLYFALKEQKKK